MSPSAQGPPPADGRDSVAAPIPRPTSLATEGMPNGVNPAGPATALGSDGSSLARGLRDSLGGQQEGSTEATANTGPGASH